MHLWLTGLSVLCSLKLSSRKADCSLESLSFFRVDPFSSSSLALELVRSVSNSMILLLLLLLGIIILWLLLLVLNKPVLFLAQKSMWNDDKVLFGDDIVTPSSVTSSPVTAVTGPPGCRFTSNPFPTPSDNNNKIIIKIKNRFLIQKK